MTETSNAPITENDAIHTYFELSYANYLVLHRTLLQSMPEEWQIRFVAMLEELDAAFAHVEKPEAFDVIPGRERDVSELTSAQMARLGYSADSTAYYDPDGNEVPWNHRVLVPTGDPVPHYNRGRTHIPPATSTDGAQP